MSKRSITFRSWAILSATVSGLLILSAALLHRDSPAFFQINASTAQATSTEPSTQPNLEPNLGPRHQLTYEQWVALLGREAKVAAEDHPKRLTILAGDSLSLWFPLELLPPQVTWLNQGISGETSSGLLRRLNLFDTTEPEQVFVMVGINDLIHGVPEETLVANYQAIIHHLRLVHPHTRIVVQSILPHAGDRLIHTSPQNLPPWANRLATTPNRQIRLINQRLAQVAKEEGADYLDLHPAFLDAQDNLKAELSTDGLHLSPQGYRVWQAQLQKLLQRPVQASTDKSQG